MTIFIHGKIDVPETDIQEVIKVCNDWLARHPERDDCKPAIFGHQIYTVRRGHVEEDVREAARTTTHTYTKLDKPIEPKEGDHGGTGSNETPTG